MAGVAQKNIFTDKGGDYYYWTIGKKSDPWILLLPGYTSSHSDLLPLAHALENYFVIVPDLPGWGASPLFPAKLIIKNYVHYLHLLLMSLGTQKLFLVGYCFGAVIALEYVRSYPEMVQANVFISTPYLKGTFFNAFPFYCAEMSKHVPVPLRPIFFLWRNRIVAIPFAFFHLHLRSWKKKLQIVKKGIKKQSNENEQAVEENWISLADFSFKNLQKITSPVHLIHGDDDVLVPLSQAKKFQKLFTHATLDVIPNTGHWIPSEKPQTLGSLVVQYLYL